MNTEELNKYAFSLIGRIVKVEKSRNGIPRGAISMIIDQGGNNVNLERWGNYKIESEKDLTVININTVSKPIVKGSEVIVNKDYTNIKKGSKIIVNDFLDDSNTRIVTEGILPGGWIDAKHVNVPLDTTNLRFKTLEELIRDFSYNFISILHLHNSIMSYLGTPVTEDILHDSLYGKEVKLVGGYRVSLAALSNEPVPTNLSLYIIETSDLKKMHAYFDGGVKTWELLKPLAGKKLTEALKLKEDNTLKDSLRKVLSNFRNGGQVYESGICIRGEYIEAK